MTRVMLRRDRNHEGCMSQEGSGSEEMHAGLQGDKTQRSLLELLHGFRLVCCGCKHIILM